MILSRILRSRLLNRSRRFLGEAETMQFISPHAPHHARDLGDIADHTVSLDEQSGLALRAVITVVRNIGRAVHYQIIIGICSQRGEAFTSPLHDSRTCLFVT